MRKIKMTESRFVEIQQMADETIGHWREVVAGNYYYRTTIDCPACKAYLLKRCEGCPIRERTGARFCERTPVVAFNDLHAYYSRPCYDDGLSSRLMAQYELAIEVKAAAQDCLDFLLMLQETILKERIAEFIKEHI